MPPKTAAVQLVEGLDLLPPKGLPSAFRRFQNDNLYFISICQYNKATMFPNAQFVTRCVALTPTAFFVTDTSGNMDRATRFEYISGIVTQVRTTSKLFGSQEELHVIIKSSKEPDIHFFFTKDHNWVSGKDLSLAKSFSTILLKILDDKRPGHGITVQDIPKDADLAQQLSTAKPQGYLSPKDIMLLNKQRKEIVTHVQEVHKELAALKKELSELKPSVSEQRDELKELEGSTSDEDLSAPREELKKLQAKISKLTASTTDGSMEINNLNRESARLQDQLAEEQKNYDSLVQSRISKVDEGTTKEQNDMMLLRQKAQKREIDKMTASLNGIIDKLNHPKPTYSGHEGFAAKAYELEAKVEASIVAWTKEMDASGKMEKFLDHISTEVEKINRHLQQQHQKKMELIEEIEGKKVEKPAAAGIQLDDSPLMVAEEGAKDIGDDLVDLSDTPKATASKGEEELAIDLDDDLLGGDTGAVSAAAAPVDEITLDDDI